MSFTVENLEKNMAKLTITVSADDFEKALQESYMKNKNKISVPGFRKGKVPRAMIEKMYGAGIFYEDAANYAIPSAYSDAAAECGLDIVSQPEIDITQIEKGKDYVTLVTCTPYAVNTHRLLVRGTRIPYEEAQKIDEEVGLQRTIPFNLILLIAGIVALIIIWVSIKLHKRRKEKKHEQNK